LSELLRPQPGPQEQFLSSPADIVIFGGAAGGGKSFGVLLETLRHCTNNPLFAAVAFRRNNTQVRNPGGLWDASMKLYPKTGAYPVTHILEWRWPGGGKVKFNHLENENTVLDWQGAEVPLIIFDELTHFLESQFWYMLSRNRSMSGVKGYIRATTNPDADSWVARLIAWWIDQDTGYAIEERSGVLRYFIRVDEQLLWANSPEELLEQYGIRDEDGYLLPADHEDQIQPKSLTFILSKLTDNKILMKSDPSYMANLKAMSRVERERLLGGNWKIKPAAGLYFKRSDVTLIDRVPTDVLKWVRCWDLAATEVGENNPNPDYTAGVLMGRRPNGKFVIADVVRERLRSQKVRELVLRTANNDGYDVPIHLPQDPGQAGKEQAESYIRELVGFIVSAERVTGDKLSRADPFAAQWQAGNVEVVRGAWNDAYFSELEQFPADKKTGHDDQVDASSDCFAELVYGHSIYDAL
jgi:predicted phage terminase large subunit-like protein